MQIVFAAIMAMLRAWNFVAKCVQKKPPRRRARNWMAPPGIWRYWVPRVSKPKEETIIDVNYRMGLASDLASEWTLGWDGG